MKRKLMRIAKALAVKLRPGPRQFDGGKVTPRFRRTVDKLMERRSELYRRLAD